MISNGALLASYIEDLKAKTGQWSSLGEKHYLDGTARIGHLSKHGSQAYLHNWYGPLSEAEVDELARIVMQPIPESLRHFYLHHNGCDLFRRSIVVFGFRKSYDRADFDTMACSPFDLVTPAVTRRNMSPSGQGLCICTYQDKSPVFIEPDGRVVRTPDDFSRSVLNEWSGFEAWMASEFARVGGYFDQSGRCTVPLSETAPRFRSKHWN
ncbi:SMI1/KNR4 family protein [Mesorhizobium quangtriensis]|uniref:SMI1/KNR4 family protein n=1 Tax=Mesorhizobium quangtriensis TaxID=3157709 RepID=UPI003CCD6906